jgi:integrase
MRQPSIYLSEYFLTIIWRKFSSNFKNPNTKDTYFSDICSFADFIKKDIPDATYNDCILYIDDLKKRRAAGEFMLSTVAKKHKELSGLFTYIKSQNFDIPDDFNNWFRKIEVELPSSAISANKVLSVTEIDQLIGYLRQNNIICLIALLLSFKQMLKTSEMINLKVSDITLDSQNNPFIRLPSIHGEFRYNKLSQDVLSLLIEHTASFDGGYILSKDGKVPYSKRTLQKYLQEACKNSGIENTYTFNDLRNTGTVFAISNGAAIGTVKNELGMITNRHITRLKSLVINFNDAGSYVNIELKQGGISTNAKKDNI